MGLLYRSYPLIAWTVTASIATGAIAYIALHVAPPPSAADVQRLTAELQAAKHTLADLRARLKNPPAPPRLSINVRTASESRPRILLYERRRGTADTAIPKLRQRGIDAEVVERLVDAADEIHRFHPDALFIDSELPDFDNAYEMLAQQNAKLPIYVTGRSGPVVRPYDIDELTAIARRPV